MSLPGASAGGNATATRVLTLGSGLVTTDPTFALTLANGASQTGETATRYVKGNLATMSRTTTLPNGITATRTAGRLLPAWATCV